MATELKEGVYWVGVVDWGLRSFHGHELSTHRGSTYNAYLILDERKVLVDTVWGPFADQLIENISELIPPEEIDIVVANHAEADHSGGLPAVMRHAPDATVVVSKRGADSIPGHYHQPWNFRVVENGDRIPIGRRELAFIEAPMLHWPDSMFSYIKEDRLLISSDAFGQHWATSERLDDEVDESELELAGGTSVSSGFNGHSIGKGAIAPAPTDPGSACQSEHRLHCGDESADAALGNRLASPDCDLVGEAVADHEDSVRQRQRMNRSCSLGTVHEMRPLSGWCNPYSSIG